MNTAARARPDRPLVPSDLPVDRLFIRACLAHVIAASRGPGERAQQIARVFWPYDGATQTLLERAASAPATTGTAGWASQLAAQAIAEFLASLSDSAGARLIEAGTRFSLPGVATLTLPRASSAAPAWTAETAPIVVAQAVITAPTLGPPKKLSLIEVITREIAEASAEDGETVIGTILRDAMSRSLDASLFSTTAADATRPAGLLAGIVASIASTDNGLAACLGDLRTLVDAIVAAGGGGNVLFFASPGRALTVQGYVPALADKVYGSASILSGELIAVDAAAFCSMFGSDPEISASRETVLHFEDTTPLPIGTPGAPNVVAAPTRSMFQTDSVALRAILRAAWALRVPGAVSFFSTGLRW